MVNAARFVIGAGNVEGQAVFVDRVVLELGVAGGADSVPCLFQGPAACGHLINDAASLCADPTAADENAYVAASVAGCNCIFLPICGCALAVVAIRDIEDGHELFASYGICSWVDDHGAEARAHAWGQFLGM
jgi:hypothetical protein